MNTNDAEISLQPLTAQLQYLKFLTYLQSLGRKNGLSLADALMAAFGPSENSKPLMGLSDIGGSNLDDLIERYRIKFYEINIEEMDRLLKKRWPVILASTSLGEEALLKRFNDYELTKKKLDNGRKKGTEKNKATAQKKIENINRHVDDEFKRGGEGWEQINKEIFRKIRPFIDGPKDNGYSDSTLQLVIDKRIAEIRKAKKKSQA